MYERYAGTTTLIGPPANAFYGEKELLGVSPNGMHIFFETSQSLVPEDNDACGCEDIYERRVAGSAAAAATTGSPAVLPNYGAAFTGWSERALR